MTSPLCQDQSTKPWSALGGKARTHARPTGPPASTTILYYTSWMCLSFDSIESMGLSICFILRPYKHTHTGISQASYKPHSLNIDYAWFSLTCPASLTLASLRLRYLLWAPDRHTYTGPLKVLTVWRNMLGRDQHWCCFWEHGALLFSLLMFMFKNLPGTWPINQKTSHLKQNKQQSCPLDHATPTAPG